MTVEQIGKPLVSRLDAVHHENLPDLKSHLRFTLSQRGIEKAPSSGLTGLSLRKETATSAGSTGRKPDLTPSNRGSEAQTKEPARATGSVDRDVPHARDG